MMYDRKVYLEQLIAVIQELKKLKEIKGISGDMDSLDELRKMNDLLLNLSYDWSIIANTVTEIHKHYIFNTKFPIEQKEVVWNIVSGFNEIMIGLSKHADYIQTTQTFLENLLTDIDKEKLTV